MNSNTKLKTKVHEYNFTLVSHKNRNVIADAQNMYGSRVTLPITGQAIFNYFCTLKEWFSHCEIWHAVS